MPSETRPDLVWGGYARISEDPNDERTGVTRQVEDITDAIIALGGTAPPPDSGLMWVENDTSAYKKRKVTITDQYGETRDAWRVVRPLWGEALRALRQGRINALLVYDLDRLARDPYDLEDALEVVVRYNGVIKSASAAELDLMTDAGQMTARLFIIIANKSSADTARRVKRAHLALAREGKPVGGNRPFGFMKNKIDHDETEVAVLREVVDEILRGKSIRDLVAALNSNGVKTTTGRTWSPQTLKQTLRSPRLAGWRVYQGMAAVDKDGNPVKGQWEPILEQDVWDRLQLKVTPKPDTRRRVPRRDSRHYLLTGLLVCGICNGPLYGNAHRDGRFYYVCNPPGKGDHGLGGSGLAIDRIVSARVLAKMHDIDTGTEVQAAQWEGAPRVAEIDADIRDAMKALRDKVLSASVVFPHVQALEAERAELEAQRVEYLAVSHLTQLGPVSADEWRDLDLGEKRTYVDALLEAVILKPATKRGNQFDGERLEYVWREAAAYLQPRSD